MKINEENIKSRISELVENKTIIPKPKTENTFRILRFGKRRNETAVIYSIPSHKEGKSHYEKGITYSEIFTALNELSKTGYLSRNWFNENLPNCAKEGGCNYTSLGGILELLGFAKYSENGKYKGVEK